MKKWKVLYKEHKGKNKIHISYSLDDAICLFILFLGNHNGPVTIIHPK